MIYTSSEVLNGLVATLYHGKLSLKSKRNLKEENNKPSQDHLRKFLR